VPESRSRRKKKQTYTPPPASKATKPSPVWWAPTMVAVMIIGLIWVVAYYLSSSKYPIGTIGDWNLAVGFGLILGGFAMTARWR
jgi:hypothetical protein